MKRLHVLLAGQDPSLPGGVAKSVGGLLNYFADCDGIKCDFFNETAVKRRVGMESFNRATAVRESLWAVSAYWRMLRILRPDVAHLNVSHSFSMLEKALLARIAQHQRVPVVLHLHGSSLDRELQCMTGAKWRWLSGAFHSPNHVIVLSPRLLTLLENRFPDAPASVVTNSVALAQPPPPLPSGPTTVGFIGFMNGRKGEQDILCALAQCRNSGLRILLAGDGPNRADAENLAQALGVSDRVSFLGLVDGPAKERFFRDIHVLCLPSYAENLPIALLEAMGHGRPVIATRVGGVPDLVVPNDTGWLFEAGDVGGLCSIFDDLLLGVLGDGREALAKAGRSAWQRVAAHHTWETNGPKIIDIYRSVMASA